MPNFKLDPRLCLALASTAGWTNFPLSYRRGETLFPAFLRQSAMSPQVVLKAPAIKTGPILIAVFITEMIILFKHVIIILIIIINKK